MSSTIPLRLAGSIVGPMFFLAAIMAGLTAIMAAVASMASPTPNGLPTGALVFGVVTVNAVVLAVMIVLGARASACLVQEKPGGQVFLAVATGFGARRLLLADASIQTVALARKPELKPVRRVFGLGLPNTLLGVFVLKNGERALCLIRGTGPVCVVREPGNQEPILISLAHPSGLVAHQST